MDRVSSANFDESTGKRLFKETPPATTISAVWLNSIQEELMTVLLHAGIAPDANSVSQLRDAIVNLIRNAGMYEVDTGVADAYVISPTPAFTSYIPGISIWFQAINGNTGASTLNISGLGPKTIKKNGGVDLVAGDILANQVVAVVYDGVYFQVTSISLNLGGANGIATLDGSSKVVQEPASKALANGVASLDASGDVPMTQIPNAALKPTTRSDTAHVVNVIYQNTGVGPIFVNVIFTGHAVTDDACNAFAGPATPPVNICAKMLCAATKNVTVSFFVPAGHYYRITLDNAVATISNWIEWN